METQFEIDTINAVPTPRFEVGDVLLAAQPLGNMMRMPKKQVSGGPATGAAAAQTQLTGNTYMTSGNNEYAPPTTK
jgi:hypothetical protein